MRGGEAGVVSGGRAPLRLVGGGGAAGAAGGGTWRACVVGAADRWAARAPVVQVLAGGLRPRGLPEPCQQVPGRVCAAVLGRSAIRAPAVTARGGVAG